MLGFLVQIQAVPLIGIASWSVRMVRAAGMFLEGKR